MYVHNNVLCALLATSFGHYGQHQASIVKKLKRLVTYTRGGGGIKNNRNLNVAREPEVVARCAARCCESTQYSSSLPRGVSIG
jgi:hypothetical protein